MDGEADPSTMSRRILVVDDEPDMRVTYERLLKRQGYDVVSAESRRAGISIVEAEPLALLICDLRLPDGSGLDLVAAAQSRRAPAIVVTGLPSIENQRAVLAAGAAGFLTRPFTVSRFSEMVRQVLTSPLG